jgi:AraC-like DNA-binding protein
LSTVGPLSVVLREEPDLRSALLLLIQYEHSYNEAIRVALTEAGGLATIRGWLVLGEPVPIRQLVEHNVAALVGVVRSLLGPGWQPRSVCFQHAPPADPDLHRHLLGPRVLFEQEFTGLVVRATEMAAANLMAHPDDPMLRTYASRVLDSLPPPPDSDLVNRVRDAIQALLPLRRCSMTRVARGLGVTKRTLHRQLAERDESFSHMVHETRHSLAECYLVGDRFTVSDVSDFLGFAAPSGFTRWFRRSFGTSPTAWRDAAAGLAPAPLGV